MAKHKQKNKENNQKKVEEEYEEIPTKEVLLEVVKAYECNIESDSPFIGKLSQRFVLHNKNVETIKQIKLELMRLY